MDYLGISSWTSYFQNAVINEHVFPTWGNLWAGGMPFFGTVPPGLYFITALISSIVGSAHYGVFVTNFIFFNLAAIFMFFFLKRTTRSNLGAFLGGMIYLILPTHSGSMLTVGLTDMLICYAILPFTLLLFEITLEKPRALYIWFTFFIIALFLIVQIEFSFLATIFVLIPYLIFRYLSRKASFVRWLRQIVTSPLLILSIVITLLFPAIFYLTATLERTEFSMHSQTIINEGRKTYSFSRITDTIKYRATRAAQIFEEPKNEYYTGYIILLPFLLLPLSLFFIKDKPKYAYGSLIVILYGGFLFAACFSDKGVFGFLVEHVPMLKEMRVTFRFYYLFALIFAMSLSLLIKELEVLLGDRRRPIIKVLVLLVIVYALFDYRSYFYLYTERAIDQNQYLPCQKITDLIAKDSGQARTKVWTNHAQSFEFCPNASTTSTMEISSTWLSWDLQTRNKILIDQGGNFTFEEQYDLLSSIMGINYAAIYYANALPDNVVVGPDHLPDLHKAFSTNKYFTELIGSRNSSRSYIIYKKNTAARDYEFYPMSSTNFIIAPNDRREALNSFVNLYNTSSDPVNFLRNNAMVEKIPNLSRSKPSTSTPFLIKSKKVTSRSIELTVSTTSSGIYVEKHLNSKWWKLTIDGKRTEIIDTNIGLIGVPLSPGNHSIKLSYNFPFLGNLKLAFVLVAWIFSVYFLLATIWSRKKSFKIFANKRS